MAEESREPQVITGKLLDALGGVKREGLVDQGAYLWGVEDKAKGEGVFNHVLKCSRVAYFLAKELKDRKIQGFEGINLEHVVDAAILHDLTKLYGEDRENLPPEVKSALGLSADFREISPAADETGASWLKNLGFPAEVLNAISEHDFPEQMKDNPYWKIVLIADYMTGQTIMPVSERLLDVKMRWIDSRLKEGLKPRIEPERFAVAYDIVNQVASELFSAIHMTDEGFIIKHSLNSNESQTRWEKFLTTTREKGKEDRARHLVKLVIDSKEK
jgi:HD superfamily phosphohydrolase YqeK